MSIPSRHSDPERVVGDERTFFVSSSTAGKCSLLQTRRSASLLVDVLYGYREQSKYLLHEFVVMRDHFHLLLTIGKGTTIERAVQFVKGGFAFRAGKEFGMRPPVWQKGFSEVRIYTWAKYMARVQYIHQNPVRAGYVNAPEEYEFSSAWPGRDLDPPPQRLKPHLRAVVVGTPEGVP